MINIIKQEITIEESLKQRLEFICEFSHTTPTFINGFIHKVDKTNLSYVEPHKIIIKGITFLAFNYSNEIYIKNLSQKIKLSELEDYLKEKIIEEYFDTFIDELVEYDSVVNQFFLPMIKQKFDEPKEELKKEIKKQNDRLERIRKAYISGAFDLEEYNAEKKIVDDTINKLEEELNETENSEELNYTPQDILLKRDIDYINKVKLKDEYEKRTKTWKDYTREEKANLIMTYVDEIKLGIMHEYIYVDNVDFKESICKHCNDLVQAGYLDV